MSIKNGLIGSAIGFALSAGVCSVFLNFTKKLEGLEEENEENNEGNVVTLTKFNNLPFKRIADGIVLLSGVYGFYYGYKNKCALLLKNL